MDYEFPRQLFPSFYNCGPPRSVLKHCAGSWGCYDRVRPQGSSGTLSSWTFASRHQVGGEAWRHTEPVPVPLLSPKNYYPWPSEPPNPLDFTEHMQNFFTDHCQDAFGCMSEILGENFCFKPRSSKKHHRDSVPMWRVKHALDTLKLKMCRRSSVSRPLEAYGALLSDAVHSVPPELLGALLHEELTEQRDRLLFSEASTGGALSFIPFSQSGRGPQHGCLLYPGGQGLDRLNFHRLELQHRRGSSSSLTSSSKPFSLQLQGPIRQISSTALFNSCCVAVRSDRLCGVWRLGERDQPRLLQVVNTREVATCISVSPHILGEVLVASESGAANLWTVGKGMQKIREEENNLYFNAKSPWRWCEFSAHPRVMLYADRTGVELTDIRVSPACGHTLFGISNTSECRSGERLILSRYLGDVHPFHHLVTTQYSAYIMDERFPCVPMLKWDHMMQSPPMFCHVLPGAGVGETRTSKVLLGSHRSQEITLLQYSGGRAEACCSRGPVQALLRPRDSLQHLPVQLPHRLDTVTDRLSSPAAGVTCVQQTGGQEAAGEECMCVLQLTEAGDLFYQILEPEPPDTDLSGSERIPHSQLVVSDTSSDDDAIGPTQGVSGPRFVAETPERGQETADEYSEDSQSEGKGRKLKRSGLQVVVNPGPDPESRLDAAKDGDKADRARPCEQQRLGGDTLITWKRWLQKLIQRSREKKPRPGHLQQIKIPTEGLLQLPIDKERAEEEHVQSLRRDLRACMSKRSLLVHGAVSASLGAPDVVPLPDAVDRDAWKDPLSRRLTVSWQGEEAWRAWWEDQLGLNKEEKMKALRRKRRREKEAKRAAGRHLELASSFTSSVSYQSDLDNFSDSAGWSSAGWSSAASQGMWSDSEGTGQLADSLTPSTLFDMTPSTFRGDATPRSVKETQWDQQTPSSSCRRSLSPTAEPDSTPASQRRRRPAEDYLNAWFAPLEESLEENTHVQEGRSDARPPPPPASSSYSQLRSSQSGPRRSLRVNLSQSSSVRSGFSQSLSLSQSSQGRLGSSQASQPKKKKSRMGF